MERRKRSNSRGYGSRKGSDPRGSRRRPRGYSDKSSRRQDRRRPHGKEEEHIRILDILAHGYPGQGPAYKRVPLILGLGDKYFSLLEIETTKKVDALLQDRVSLKQGEGIVRRVKRRLAYTDLTPTAQDMIETTVEMILEDREDYFVKFFNLARPITTRKHQLQLLPGIGKKHMWDILNAREAKPFESFADFEERTSINPFQLLTRRILHEIEIEDEKYRLFTREPPSSRRR